MSESSHSSEHTHFESLLRLVGNCLQFTLDSRHFMDRTDGLHRIGINAQILAAHSSEGGEVLGVLVREIGQLTRSISGTLSEFARSGTELARMTIRTADRGYQLRTHGMAISRVIDPHNHALMVRNRAQRWEQIEVILADVRSRFQHHRVMLGDIRRSTVFIPALVSLLKINVAAYEESIAQFHQTAADLTEFREFLEQATARMLMEIDESMAMIDGILDRKKDDAG